MAFSSDSSARPSTRRWRGAPTETYSSCTEILLVGGTAEDGALEASLRRFGVPVTRLGERLPARRRNLLREAARGLAAGRSKATPFVLFVGVNLVLLSLAALLTLVVLLVLWLS